MYVATNQFDRTVSRVNYQYLAGESGFDSAGEYSIYCPQGFKLWGFKITTL